MRFSTFLISASFAILAHAQTNVTAATSTRMLVPSTTWSLTPAQSSEAACLSACNPTDAVCREDCIVPSPGDYSRQNATIECVSACPQGNGTAQDNLNYENCQKDCIASATTGIASTLVTATATGTGAIGTDATGIGATGSGATGGSTTKTGSGSGSSTTSSSPLSTSSSAAAGEIQMGLSLTGVIGVFAAVFAL